MSLHYHHRCPDNLNRHERIPKDFKLITTELRAKNTPKALKTIVQNKKPQSASDGPQQLAKQAKNKATHEGKDKPEEPEEEVFRRDTIYIISKL